MRNPSPSSSTPAPTTKPTTTTTKTTPCCSKIGLKRGPWTPQEDELLANYINKEGEGRWRTLPKRAGLLRCGKSCRLRWMNYLRPNVKRGQIAPDEEDLILRLHRLLGNRWSLIAGRIPGRTDNEIKNYWNTHLSKKLISQGIDPRTHKPLNPDNHSDIKTSSSKNNRNGGGGGGGGGGGTSNAKPNSNNPDSSSSLDESSSGGNKDLNPSPDEGMMGLGGGFGFTSLLNCDDVRMDVRRSNDNVHQGLSNNEEDEDINYCTDDVFSSFLNSLINEEAFANQHQVMQLQQVAAANGSLAQGPNDALISSFGIGTSWEPPLLASSFIPNDPNKEG